MNAVEIEEIVGLVSSKNKKIIKRESAKDNMLSLNILQLDIEKKFNESQIR